MNLKRLIYFVIPFFVFISCGDGSSGNKSNAINNSSSSNSLNGTYTNSSGECRIIVSGARWSGKIVIETGFGSAYDQQNAQYSNGIIKDDDLYDESGYVKIGYISNNSLTTILGGKSITLYK